MKLIILPQLKSRLKPLKYFSRYQKIRKIIKVKSNLFSLRMGSRRPWQVWRWRFNRKAYQTWKPIRYIKPYALNSLTKLRYQTNFRLQRTIKKYWQWRFSNKSFNLSSIQYKFLKQNSLQNYHEANLWLRNHIGISGINFYQWRYMTNWNKNFARVNNLPAINQIVDKNAILTFSNQTKKLLLNRTLAFETNNLINGLIQHNLNKSALIAKYTPKQQRHLNSILI